MAKYKYKLNEMSKTASAKDAEKQLDKPKTGFEVGQVTISDDGTHQTTITNINPQTGAISWDLKNLPGFDMLYNELDGLVDVAKRVYIKTKDDKKFRDFYDQVRKLRNSVRTHLRNEYPDQYKRIVKLGEAIKIPDPTSFADMDDEEKEQIAKITGPLRDLIKQFKLKKEVSMSGAAGSYLTPYAFSRNSAKKADDEDNKELGYKLVKEGHSLSDEDIEVLKDAFNALAVSAPDYDLKKIRSVVKYIINTNVPIREALKGKTEYSEGEVKYSIGVDDDYEGWVDVAFQKGFKYDEDKDIWYGPVDENIDLERLGVGYATPKFKKGDEVDYLGRKAKVRSAKFNIYDKSFDYTIDYRDDNNQRTSADGVKDNDLKRPVRENIGNKINIARAKSHFKQGEKITAINKKTKKLTKITGANQFGSLDPKEYDFAYLTEIINLVHVKEPDGSLYGTGEIVKVEKDKTWVKFDGDSIKKFDSERVVPIQEDATKSANIHKQGKDPGATLGPGPSAGPDGVTDNAYVKQFKFKLVPKNKDGTYVQKGSTLPVRKLWG